MPATPDHAQAVAQAFERQGMDGTLALKPSQSSQGLGQATALLSLLFASPALAETPVLHGRRVSSAPEDLSQIHATRDVTFAGDAWKITFRTFGDAALTVPIFGLDVSCYYKIGGESAAVPGAYSGMFGATSKVLVADSDIAVKTFGDMGCTLEVGVSFDLTDKACGFFDACMDAAVEYDLV